MSSTDFCYSHFIVFVVLFLANMCWPKSPVSVQQTYVSFSHYIPIGYSNFFSNVSSSSSPLPPLSSYLWIMPTRTKFRPLEQHALLTTLVMRTQHFFLPACTVVCRIIRSVSLHTTFCFRCKGYLQFCHSHY